MDKQNNEIVTFVLALINKILEMLGFDLRLKQSEQDIM